MNTRGRFWKTPLAALAIGAMLSGCAPSFGGSSFGPGLGIGLNLGMSGARLGLTPSTCLLHGTASPQAATGQMSAAVVAGARMKQISAIQARYGIANLTFSTLTIEGWKKAAEGGC